MDFINLLEVCCKKKLTYQNDAHELLLNLVDKFKNENKDFIDNFFNGKTKTTLRCTECQNKRIIYGASDRRDVFQRRNS